VASPRPDRLKYLSANIRRLRLRRGWTQEQLAEAAGIDDRYVRTLETPSANPRAGVLVAVADALGASLGPLFRPAKLPKKRRGRPPST
jgi:transcriptional regulator with XRE-family HTH domain